MDLIKALLFFVFQITFVFAHSQEQIIGKVISNEGIPIENCSIGYLKSKWGCYSNKNGNFKLKKINNDSIVFSAINFRKFVIPISYFDTCNVVHLSEIIKNLDEIFVTYRKKNLRTIYLGNSSTSSDMLYSFGPNTQYAIYIPNDEKVNGYIDEIKFKLSDVNNSTYDLLIRIYDLDTINYLPQSDLLLYDNVFLANNLKRNNSLITNKSNIKIPPNGVFVSFQWIPVNKLVSPKVYQKTPYIVSSISNSQAIIFSNYMGLGWNKFKNNFLVNGDSNSTSPCVSLKISSF